MSAAEKGEVENKKMMDGEDLPDIADVEYLQQQFLGKDAANSILTEVKNEGKAATNGRWYKDRE